MAMAALPNLITVEQFRQLPEGGGFAYELHHGKAVAMTAPKSRHVGLQRQTARLVEAALPDFEIFVEYPYRPLPEFELRVADIAVIGRKRFAAIDPEDNLYGAPELVIEVKSPSNSLPKLEELATLCLANGAIEFWIAEGKTKSITVIQRDKTRKTYGVDSEISLAAFGGSTLAVKAVFA